MWSNLFWAREPRQDHLAIRILPELFLELVLAWPHIVGPLLFHPTAQQHYHDWMFFHFLNAPQLEEFFSFSTSFNKLMFSDLSGIIEYDNSFLNIFQINVNLLLFLTVYSALMVLMRINYIHVMKK